MKSITKIFVAIVLLLSLTGCGKLNKSYTEISYKEYLQKIENKESFILFIGSSQCPHCDDFKKTVNKLINKHDITIYYIDIYKMKENSQSDYNTFDSLTNYGGETPITIFINNGIEDNVYTRILGSLPYETVENKLKDQGYIK